MVRSLYKRNNKLRNASSLSKTQSKMQRNFNRLNMVLIKHRNKIKEYKVQLTRNHEVIEELLKEGLVKKEDLVRIGNRVNELYPQNNTQAKKEEIIDG